jgi:preprotein translocase subunit SecF
MLQIIHDTRIPFMKYRRYAYAFSLVVMVVGVVSLIMHGGKFRLGVDFAGGHIVEYRFSQPVTADHLRRATDKLGHRGAEIQEVGSGGTDFLVRLPVEEEALASQTSPSVLILQELQKEMPGLQGELRKEEVVGPRVGRELRGKAFVAVLVSLIMILIWVGIRYEFTYALGGVLALAHDVLAVLLMCSVFNKEITIPVIAALLTIGGYSINDTIVVFDRIREQSKLLQKRSLIDIMDLSVNQTLSRTMITSATVFYAVAALFFLGGEVIHDFAFAMMWGVGFGSYSSVYIASALALEIAQKRQAKIKTKAAA